MTRRLLLTFVASTTLVMLGFLVPLWITVGNLVEAQAQREAVITVQPLVNQLPLVAPDQVDRIVTRAQGASPGLITVYLPDGRVLGEPVPAGDSVALARRGLTFFRTEGDSQVLYAAATGTDPATPAAVVRYALPEGQTEQGVLTARLVLAGLGLLLFVVAAFVTWQLARSFLVPIRALAETADRLSAGDLSARVEPDGPPEIRDVGTALNRLADRIDELLRDEREDVADLAHRLRTPVTVLALDADSLADADERARVAADVERLNRMVDEVIHEARRPVREGVRASCDAVAVVRGRAEFWRVLAEDQARALTVSLPPGPRMVRCDDVDLSEALDALINNVFHHTEEGAALAVTMTAEGVGTLLVVEDGGAGLPETAVVAPIAGGTEVQGQVTLDLCSGTFASESLRLERLQTAVFQASGEATFSTEAVLYRSPAATDQAFRELRSVSASCPTTPVTNASGETVTYRFQEAPDTAWPRTKGVDRQAYRFTVTQSDGTVRTLDAVYLKRGPVLLGLYFLDPDGAQTPVEGRTTVPGIVALFEQRLLRDGSGSGVDSGTGTTA